MEMFQDVGPKSVENLLHEVDQGISKLPDFQRSFVWDPTQTLSLLVSVAKGYPAGSILRFHDTKYQFGVRPIEGVDESKIEPVHMFLVLDGQQRLTSLYQALYGKGDFTFYVDLQRFGETEDIAEEDVIFFEKTTSKRARYLAKGVQQQAESWVFPLSVLSGVGFLEWRDEAVAFVPTDQQDDFKSLMGKLHKTHLKTFENYQFPVVTLKSDVSIDALCMIFETINRTGVKLSLFELMTARFYKDGVNLRNKWTEAVETYPLFAEERYGIDPYYILQAIAMKVSPTHSCKRQAILGLSFLELTENWDDVCEGLNEGLKILREECKVLSRRWLATPSMLGPLAALMSIDKPVNVQQKGQRRVQVRRWLWCAIFSQRYQAAANTRAEKDVGEMVKWFRGGDVPSMISSFSINDVSLRDASSPSSPVYKGVICLALLNGARDFAHFGAITEQMIAVGDVDDHHIFPRKYLEDLKKTKSEINCVINRTLIDSETNKKISANPPTVYLPKIGLKAEETAILKSHLIPTGSESPLYFDDFERFLDEREQLLLQKIAEVTS